MPPLTSGRRATPALQNLVSQPFTQHQKRSLDLRSKALRASPQFIHPDLSFYNPPSDNNPFMITPSPFVSYPGVAAPPVTVISYQVPPGMFAIINKLAIVHFGGNNPDGTGQVIWRVLKNGAGMRGLNSLTSQVGTYAQPNDIVLLAVENDVVIVTVELPALLPGGGPNNPMPAGTTTAARFHGWTYPIQKSLTQFGVAGK